MKPLTELTTSRASTGAVLIRLMVGTVFFFEGIQKFLYPDALGAGRFEKIGIPVPHLTGPFVGGVETICGVLLVAGLLTRLAAIPLLINISVAILSTKIPILLGHGFWTFTLAKLPRYGFLSMMHEARTDFSMLLGLFFLLIVGAGAWSVDTVLARKLMNREAAKTNAATIGGQRCTTRPELIGQAFTSISVSSCLCCCWCAVPWAALAGPPFTTDDPEPVKYRHWEFYVGSQNTKSADGWSGTAPHFEVNYGAVTNLQLHLIVPLAYDAPAHGARQYGSGDTEVGAKYRFIQETDVSPQVGFFPLLEIPTGNANRGLGSGQVQAFLPVWLQKEFGSWTVYGGGGYGINPGAGNQNWGYGGLVAQCQICKSVLLGAEVYHRTAMRIGTQADTAFNLGAVIDISERHHLLFSAGRSIAGPTEFQAYSAYQFTF